VMSTKERTMNRIALMLASSSLLFLVMTGCGGGGGTTGVLQQKTATITFSTVSSAHTAPLQGIQVTTRLPAGANVTNLSTALIGRNDTGQVVPGLLSLPVVTFSVQQTGTGPIKFGPFAALTCDIATGFTLDQSSFSILSGDLQMTGKDASGNTVDLVPQIPVKLSVSFGF
jgi:hypothetical protein